MIDARVHIRAETSGIDAWRAGRGACDFVSGHEPARRHRLEFGHRHAVAGHDHRMTGLHVTQDGRGLIAELIVRDGTHPGTVADGPALWQAARAADEARPVTSPKVARPRPRKARHEAARRSPTSRSYPSRLSGESQTRRGFQRRNRLPYVRSSGICAHQSSNFRVATIGRPARIARRTRWTPYADEGTSPSGDRALGTRLCFFEWYGNSSTQNRFRASFSIPTSSTSHLACSPHHLEPGASFSRGSKK